MPILVDQSSRIICHGTSTEEQLLHIHQCISYGSKIVAFVDPDCEKKRVLGLPVFFTVEEAKKQTNANVAWVYSSPSHVADALLEAEDAGIDILICETQHCPIQDLVQVKESIRKNKKSRLIGPGSFGIITPGQVKVGVMPGYLFTKGSIGVISRYATVAYEAAWQLTSLGKGQSTCVGIGREASLVDMLDLFEKDSRTKSILLIGRSDDHWKDVCRWRARKKRKPLFVYIPGVQKRMDMLYKAHITVIKCITDIGKSVI